MSDNAGLLSIDRARDQAAVRSLQWSDVVMTYVSAAPDSVVIFARTVHGRSHMNSSCQRHGMAARRCEGLLRHSGQEPRQFVQTLR